ncbi:MAG: hypothetical protein MUE80_06670, partial [Acidobacteria bacterium]|nr:hypothetical protein [Acidobacteriota bacterium]
MKVVKKAQTSTADGLEEADHALPRLALGQEEADRREERDGRDGVAGQDAVGLVGDDLERKSGLGEEQVADAAEDGEDRQSEQGRHDEQDDHRPGRRRDGRPQDALDRGECGHGVGPTRRHELDERLEAERQAQRRRRDSGPRPRLLPFEAGDEADAHGQEAGGHDQDKETLGHEADPVGGREGGPGEGQRAQGEGQGQPGGQNRRQDLGRPLEALGQEHPRGQGDVLFLARGHRRRDEGRRQDQVLDP